jgi:hypothetical protein
MAGGNSHQRAVERRAQKRIKNRVSEAVDKALAEVGISSTMPKQEPGKNPDKTPWYQSGLFWGFLSSFLAVVLVVVASLWKDLRWLLIPAWPLAIVPTWLACREISRRFVRWIVFVSVSALSGTVLLFIALRAPKPEVPSAAQVLPQSNDLGGIQKGLDEINRHLSEMGRPEISTAQMEAIREVGQFIGEPDEMALRKEFGFPEMMDTNIRAIVNNLRRYKRTGINHHYAMPPGDTLIDNRFAKGHIHRKGGGFEMDMDDTTVYFIMLPKDYVSNKARLLKMANSTELPTVVVRSLKHFDSVIQQNATHLIEVLSAAMDKDQNLFLEYDNFNSPLVHELDALYLDTFVQLRPEADKVRDAIRQSLGVK